MKSAIIRIAVSLCFLSIAVKADPVLDEQLCVASGAGTSDQIRLLLRQGASANANCTTKTGDDRFGPLYLAVKADSVDTVASLLDAGALVNASEAKYGLSAVFIIKSPAVGDLLFRHDADAKLRNKAGLTPFEYLTVRVSASFPAQQAAAVGELYLKHGADINATGQADGATPLMTAAVLGRIDYAKFLLDHGADPNIRNKRGETALTIVRNLSPLVVTPLSKDYDTLATMLRAHGAMQ